MRIYHSCTAMKYLKALGRRAQGRTFRMQAAHDGEVASLRAATAAAEEHSRDLQSQHDAEMDDKAATIAELNEEIEQLQAKAAALEANIGINCRALLAAPQLLYVRNGMSYGRRICYSCFVLQNTSQACQSFHEAPLQLEKAD